MIGILLVVDEGRALLKDEVEGSQMNFWIKLW